MPVALPCSRNATLQASIDPTFLRLTFSLPDIQAAARRLFLAIASGASGSSMVPFAQNLEGSTTFLPISASHLFSIINSPSGAIVTVRTWRLTEWSPWTDASHLLSATYGLDTCSLTLPFATFPTLTSLSFVLYAKDLSQNNAWGQLIAASDSSIRPAIGDQNIPGYIDLPLSDPLTPQYCTRLQTPERVRIYQLLVRLFGNVNETRKTNGSLADNGVGKFQDINDAAIASIRALGCTHIWLTGILRQATSTDYSRIGLPADDPDLLKGLAGSPYAIRDYFDVCPDYARDPVQRLPEFKALVDRIHAHGLQVIIDLVPNHVARSYRSVVAPDLSFGEKDDRSAFFRPDNNFFYLRPTDPGGGPPLRLPTFDNGVPVSPTCKVLHAGDGLFDPEKDHARVSGNNVISWSPGINDWYETVKLNYGIDFTDPSHRFFPHAADPDAAIPDTWRKMDQIIAYWQGMGIDGFRCDMSHMIPPEFWAWAIGRARERNPAVWFMGEAYNDDPMKISAVDPLAASLDNAMFSLLNAGFNAIYDDPSYKALKRIYDGPCWANDFDRAITSAFIYENSLRYAENHDEVRLAAHNEWGGVGMDVGRPVSAILYGVGRGPLMLYSGQEVGEPAGADAGFAGPNPRTTIFDYWSMPEFVKWVNHHEYNGALLSPQQQALRAFYARLLHLVGEPGFRAGGFLSLNQANEHTPNFGNVDGDPVSGHWMYAFLRYDVASGQRWLVIANLHHAIIFSNILLLIPQPALDWLEIPSTASLTFTDCLNDPSLLTAKASASAFPTSGVQIPSIPPLSAMYLEITQSPE